MGHWIIYGFICGLLFVLFRDLAITLSNRNVTTVCFAIGIYLTYGVISSIIAVVLYFIWNV